MTDEIVLRPATLADADAMAEVQNAIHAAGLRATPSSPALILERYINASGRIACTVAQRGGQVLGFQSLKRAGPDNPYGVTSGWGIIGTHIRPDAGRSGIGRRLFAQSLHYARDAGLRHIDATIADDNGAALAYYQAMGFTPYRKTDGASPHRFDL